ncbi:MAG: sulfite exporter TauE/SafE family protein [bacterium]|nr:sulfite exporter TauE/SafE family protein [bacterium]
MTEALFFILAFISEVAGTVIGFGSSAIFLPLALLFVDFKTALVLVAFLHIFGNIGRITFFRHRIDKRLIYIFGIPSVALTIPGALLVNHIPQEILKAVLGLFFLLFAAISLVRPALKFPANKPNAIIGGGLSGFLAGLIGTGGALRGAFLTAFGLEKGVYLATAAAIALAVDITRIPIYFAGGFLEQKYYAYIPVLFVLAIAGSYIGKKVVNKIPQKIFRNIVLVVLAIIGLKFMSGY